MAFEPAAFAAIVGLFFVVLYKKLLAKPCTPYPPGPPSDPVIGHVCYMPKTLRHEWYHKLREDYGNIIHLNALGQSMIIVNNNAVAEELLEKRGLYYSERPRTVMVQEILGFSGFLYKSYTKQFLKQRSLMAPLFTRLASKKYEPIQLRESQVMMKNLHDNPKEFLAHIRRFTSSIVLEIGYGHRVTTDDDKYVAIVSKVSAIILGAGPRGASPPEIFPMLQHLPPWFPGAWWSKYRVQQRPHVRAIFDYPFDDVLAQMAKGTASPSFVQHLMEELQNSGNVSKEDAEDVKEAAATLYMAGAETTWITIMVFFLVMLIHPDVQKRAQQELDSVVGPDTLPTFMDRPSMPYLECIMQEIFRCYPAAPIGLPHRNREDDIFDNMLIPANSIIIANAYGINRDPAVYKDAESFQPERFLPKPEGRGEPYPKGTFGYGRRVCPGQWMVEAALWVVMAHTLAMFNLKCVVGDDGKEIIPKVEFIAGVLPSPKPFECNIVPRSRKLLEVVEQAVAGY